MRLFTLLLISILAICAYADDDMDIYGKDYVPKNKWKEQEVKLPAYPNDKNLVELELPHSRLKYYIDTKSISVGKKDHIARFTVIVKSPSGVRNVFYEGIRCSTKEYRTYAYATNRTTQFKLMPGSLWRPIRGVGAYKYRLTLYDYFVCYDSAVRRKPKDIVRTLKHPPTLHAPEVVD